MQATPSCSNIQIASIDGICQLSEGNKYIKEVSQQFRASEQGLIQRGNVIFCYSFEHPAHLPSLFGLQLAVEANSTGCWGYRTGSLPSERMEPRLRTLCLDLLWWFYYTSFSSVHLWPVIFQENNFLKGGKVIIWELCVVCLARHSDVVVLAIVLGGTFVAFRKIMPADVQSLAKGVLING